MMMKFILLVFMVFIVSSTMSLAQDEFSLDAGLRWINNSVVSSNWDKGIDEVAFSILALGANGYNVDEGVDNLKERMNSDGSWNNRVYDTSLAILALYAMNEDVEKSVNWLLGEEEQAIVNGDWLIQIKTDTTGSCDISVGNENPVNFEVKPNEVSCDYDGNGDGWGSWIDLESCGGFSISKLEEVSVNCNNLGNADIYLIYKLDNNFYLLEDKRNTNRATLTIENAFYGDYESTAYASWVLNELGRVDDIHTGSYLRSNSREGSVLDRAILFRLTGEDMHKEWLEEHQNNFTGSWDGNVFNTAFSVYSLEGRSGVVSKGKRWLEGEQNTRETSFRYGSWGGDLLDSSFVLWSVFSTGYLGTGSGPSVNGSDVNGSIGGYCGDGFVDPNEECDATYFSNGDLRTGTDEDCGIDEKCVPPEEEDECTCKTITTGRSCVSDDDCRTGVKECDRFTNKCVPIEDKCGPSNECSEINPCEEGYTCDFDSCECKPLGVGDRCTSNDDCDTGKKCGDNSRCVDIEGYCETDFDCTEDNQVCDSEINKCVNKERGFPWRIITLIVLIIAGILVYWFVFKKGKKKPKGKPRIEDVLKKRPTIRPSYLKSNSRRPIIRKPVTRKSSVSDERLEKELDRSLRKAKQILDKK